MGESTKKKMKVLLYRNAPSCECCLAVAVYSSVFFCANQLQLCTKPRFIQRIIPELFNNARDMHYKWKTLQPRLSNHTPTPTDFISLLELSTPSEDMYMVGMDYSFSSSSSGCHDSNSSSSSSERYCRTLESKQNGLLSVLRDAGVHSSIIIVIGNCAISVHKFDTKNFTLVNPHRVSVDLMTLKSGMRDPAYIAMDCSAEFVINNIGNLWGNVEFACLVLDNPYIKTCDSDVLYLFELHVTKKQNNNNNNDKKRNYGKERKDPLQPDDYDIGDNIDDDDDYYDDDDDIKGDFGLRRGAAAAAAAANRGGGRAAGGGGVGDVGDNFIDDELKNAMCTVCLGNGVFYIMFVVIIFLCIILLTLKFIEAIF